ncbi:hypothetical protein ACWC5I_02140 [Kitasatospora sp. NPDC001574]
MALEAISGGTPVEPTGHGFRLLIDHDAGPAALHKATRTLLEDDTLHGATTQTVYRLADDFAPHRIAHSSLEAAS